MNDDVKEVLAANTRRTTMDEATKADDVKDAVDELRRAEIERDALRAQVEAWRVTSRTVVDESAALRAELRNLQAQVEAARTYARQALDYGEDCDATDLLAAMDGAKP